MHYGATCSGRCSVETNRGGYLALAARARGCLGVFAEGSHEAPGSVTYDRPEGWMAATVKYTCTASLARKAGWMWKPGPKRACADPVPRGPGTDVVGQESVSGLMAVVAHSSTRCTIYTAPPGARLAINSAGKRAVLQIDSCRATRRAMS